MHVARTGTWLSIKQLSGTDEELSFLSEIGADLNTKACEYRVKYSEPILRRLVDYVSKHDGTLDATCSAIATFSYSWSNTLAETEVDSKRPAMRHQKQGVTFLLKDKHNMLGFDMGTGKTKTAVDTADYLIQHNLADNVLVITDASVVDTWVSTLIAEDSDHPSIALLGSRTERISKLRYGLTNGYKYFVINYDGVPVIDDELRIQLSSRTVIILDESQRVKNHTTRRFKTLWGLNTKHNFEFIFLLSGTPITQSPEDAFGQFCFIDTSIFGSPKSGIYGFRSTYIQTSSYDKHVITGYRNMQKFLEKFHSRCFRVRTEDVVDLPEKRYLPVYLEMPVELKKVYKEYIKSKGFVRVTGHPAQADRDEMYVSTHPFTMLQKSLQIVNNFLYLPTIREDDEPGSPEIVELFPGQVSPKIEYLLQLVEDTDQKIIVWFQLHGAKQSLERELLANRVPFVTVDGSVPIDKRPALLTRFAIGRERILLAQESTLQTGVSLVCSTINVYFERGFKIASRQQSEKRTHRIGMGTVSPMYIDLIYKGTAEETVYKKLQDGIELSEALVDLNNIDLILTGEWDRK